MKSNRLNLLLVIFISLVSLFSLYMWIINDISKVIKNDSLNSVHSSKKLLIKELIELSIDSMRPVIFDITRDQFAIEAFNKNDIKSLKEELLPTYRRLSTMGTIDSIQIFNKNGEIYFSAPYNFKSKINTLIKKSKIFKKIYSSPFYNSDNNFVIGISFPLYNSNEFSGTVLLSKKFNDIIERYNEHNESTSTIITYDDFQNRRMPDIWKDFKMTELYKYGFSIEKIGNKYFNILAIPIKGAEDKIIAYFISSKDFTVQYEKIISRIDKYTLILLITSIIIFAFIYIFALKYSKIIYRKG